VLRRRHAGTLRLASELGGHWRGSQSALPPRDQRLLAWVQRRRSPTKEVADPLFGVSEYVALCTVACVVPGPEAHELIAMRLPDPDRRHCLPLEALLAITPGLTVLNGIFGQRVRRPKDRAAADTHDSGKPGARDGWSGQPATPDLLDGVATG
jgi:hypothetical protein